MEMILPFLLAIAIWPTSLLFRKWRDKHFTVMQFTGILVIALYLSFFPPRRPLYSYLLFALLAIAGIVKSVKERKQHPA